MRMLQSALSTGVTSAPRWEQACTISTLDIANDACPEGTVQIVLR